VVVIVAELPAPDGADAETAAPKDELAPETDMAAVALNPLRAPSVGLSSPAPAPAPAPTLTPEPGLGVLAVAADLYGCAQPRGRVPLSDACTRARAVSPLLPAVQLPTSLPAAVAAISQATREVARQRDKQEAAARDVQKKPPSVVAVPDGAAQDDTLAAGGGSTGGSTSGARTLRIDAIHQRISPLPPPSTFPQAPIPDLVPMGELEAPPTARPG
jgi:hypothetical protein